MSTVLMSQQRGYAKPFGVEATILPDAQDPQLLPT